MFTNYTNYEIFVQLIGLVAFLIGVTTFAQKDEKRFKIQLASFSFVLSIHYLLLGATTAGLACIVSTARGITSMYTRNSKIALGFIVLVLIGTYLTYTSWVSWLPVAGTVVTTWMLFKGTGIDTRICILFSSCLWFIHNIIVGSIGGILVEMTFIIFNSFNIIKFYKMIKTGENPLTSADIKR